MRGRVSQYRVQLNRKPRQRLEALVRRRTPEHYMVMRAKIVLASADGLSIGRVCAVLSLDHQVVRRWIKRYIGLGYDGLKDHKRSGRPPAIDPTVWQKVTTIVVQPPKKFGVPLTRWSLRELCAFLRERFGWNISRASISRFLRSMALRPHKVRYWLNPSDPDFDRKAARICRLYIAPPAGSTVLSIDEKPGIQALRRIHPTRPLRPGKPGSSSSTSVRALEISSLRSISRTDRFSSGALQTGRSPGYSRSSTSLSDGSDGDRSSSSPTTSAREQERTPRNGSRDIQECASFSPRSTVAGSTRSRSGSAFSRARRFATDRSKAFAHSTARSTSSDAIGTVLLLDPSSGRTRGKS